MKESLLMRWWGGAGGFLLRNAELLGASRNLGGKSSLGARLRTRKVTAQGRFAACDQVAGYQPDIWESWLKADK